MRERVTQDNGKDTGGRHILKGFVEDTKESEFYSKCYEKLLDSLKPIS